MHIIVMGVSGAGKTTLARSLSQRLDWLFQEGDDLHPTANVAKMRAGVPLNDADRAPWLNAIRAWMERNRAAGKSGIVSCSALKHAYRELLRGEGMDVRFVHLAADRSVLAEHIAKRTDHYMPPSLLDSQLATLDAPSPSEALLIDAALPTHAQVNLVVAVLGRL